MRESSLSSASEVGSLGGATEVNVGRTGVVDLNVCALLEEEDETVLEDESPEDTVLLEGDTVEEEALLGETVVVVLALLGEMVVVVLLTDTPGEEASVTTRGGTMELGSSMPGSSSTRGFFEMVEVSG